MECNVFLYTNSVELSIKGTVDDNKEIYCTKKPQRLTVAFDK